MSDHIEKYMRKVGDSPSITGWADYEQLKRRISTLEAQLKKCMALLEFTDEESFEWIKRRDALLAKIKEEQK